jgi:hypothetical protein
MIAGLSAARPSLFFMQGTGTNEFEMSWENPMNVLKFALLGTAALAVMSVGARAESLSDLKAQIESLNARIATLEAAPSVPAGYNLMSFSAAPQILSPGDKLGPNDYAMPKTIQILPTADTPEMPATAMAQWTGHVKAAIVHERVELLGTITEETHIVSNAELNLKAANDTAVGEVGVHIRMEASADGSSVSDFEMSRGYGWWKATPEISLRAGYKDSIGGVGHGNDKCSCNFNEYVGVVGGTDNATQFELRYGSGPIEAAIAIEHQDDYNDDDASGGVGDVTGEGQTYVFAGEVKWSGDTIAAELSGYWGEKAGDTAAIYVPPVLPAVIGTYTGDVDTLNDTAVRIWQIGAGISGSFNAISLSAAAGYGEIGDAEHWEASLFGSANLTDSISLEMGAGYESVSDAAGTLDLWGVAGGLYWSPVDKLTLGAEASWVQADVAGGDATSLTADVVSVFKF